MKTVLVVLVVLAVSGSAGGAGAGVTISSPHRQITAFAFVEERSLTADVLAPWSASVYHEYTDAGHTPGQPSWGRASQASFVGPDYITASGTESGFDGIIFSGQGDGSGFNAIEATLIVTTPTAFSFAVSFVPTSGQYHRWGARLTGPGSGDVFQFDWFANGSGTFSSAGTLAPGTYAFTSSFLSGGAGLSVTGGSSEFTMALQVPAPWSALALLPMLSRRRR